MRWSSRRATFSARRACSPAALVCARPLSAACLRVWPGDPRAVGRSARSGPAVRRLAAASGAAWVTEATRRVARLLPRRPPALRRRVERPCGGPHGGVGIRASSQRERRGGPRSDAVHACHLARVWAGRRRTRSARRHPRRPPTSSVKRARRRATRERCTPITPPRSTSMRCGAMRGLWRAIVTPCTSSTAGEPDSARPTRMTIASGARALEQRIGSRPPWGRQLACGS